MDSRSVVHLFGGQTGSTSTARLSSWLVSGAGWTAGPGSIFFQPDGVRALARIMFLFVCLES